MEPILSTLASAEEIVRGNETDALLLALLCSGVALLLSLVAIVRSGRRSRRSGMIRDLQARVQSLESAEERRLLAGVRRQGSMGQEDSQRPTSV